MTGLSRQIVSTSTGKLTAVVPTFKIDEDTFEEANMLARKAGMSLSELVRTLVMGMEQVSIGGSDV